MLTDKRYDVEEISEVVATTVEERLWEKAANHHLGMGLEKGIPNFEPARRARQKLL